MFTNIIFAYKEGRMRKFKVKVNGKEYVVEIEEIKDEETSKESEASEKTEEKAEEN